MAKRISVHGGVTYAAACEGHICHVPREGEPAHVWWIGFDCGHCFDLSPSFAREFEAWQHFVPPLLYRDQEYVRAQVEKMAAQIAPLASHP